MCQRAWRVSITIKLGRLKWRKPFREIGFPGSLITGDMVIAHAGALGGRPGVLAAGTGSCILGIGPTVNKLKWVAGDQCMAMKAALIELDRRRLRVPPGATMDVALKLTTWIALKVLKLHDSPETLKRVYVDKMEPRK